MFSRSFVALEISVKATDRMSDLPCALGGPDTVRTHPWLDELMPPRLDPQWDFGLQQAKLPLLHLQVLLQ